MKGVIFTNFLKMVDETFSPEVTEEIIERANLPSGGAYTTVGAYDHAEILALVVALSELTSADSSALVRAFGKYLFGALGAAHPEYISDINSSFDLLKEVQDHIHVEVRKLYPDAELPKIECVSRDDDLTVHYQSERPFASVAEGLIEGCIDHFKDNVTVERQDFSDDGRHAVFVLKRVA
ncbi:MAG: heme NO-binding domain-containing protein [Pseudomonadota bacterium]